MAKATTQTKPKSAPTASKASAPTKPAAPTPASAPSRPEPPPGILTGSVIEKMDKPARVAAFVDCANSQQRAFSSMGKIFHILQRDLVAPETVFGTLQAAGIKKGTLSNSSYAAKVYKLVIDGHLSEEFYDTLAFRECFAAVRVMSKESKLPHTAVALAGVMLKSDQSKLEDELNSLFEHGMTVAEKIKHDTAAPTPAPVAPAKPAAVPVGLGLSTAPTAAPTPPPANVPTNTPTMPTPAAAAPVVPAKPAPAPIGAVTPNVVVPMTAAPAAAPTHQDANRFFTALEDLILELSADEAEKVAVGLEQLAAHARDLIGTKRSDEAKAKQPAMVKAA